MKSVEYFLKFFNHYSQQQNVTIQKISTTTFELKNNAKFVVLALLRENERRLKKKMKKGCCKELAGVQFWLFSCFFFNSIDVIKSFFVKSICFHRKLDQIVEITNIL